MNLNKSLKLVILLLIIVEILFSGWLVYKNLTTADVCIIGDSCNGVQNSDFGEIFGIKLSYLGLFAFIALLIVFFLKKRLFLANLKPKNCEICGWAKVTEDGYLPLELDHINGNSKDNRLENLRVLCPNCHSLKPTHRGRNIRKN